METGLEAIAGLGGTRSADRPLAAATTIDLVSGEIAAPKDALISRFRGSRETPRPYTPDHLLRMRSACDIVVECKSQVGVAPV